jgi:mannose/fructose/N-acetylgalactosamine-specific phosphotransferase system component IIC
LKSYGLVFASAFAVAVSTGPAPAAAVAETTTASTAGTIFAWTSKVHREGTTAVVLPMEHGDGTLSFL